MGLIAFPFSYQLFESRPALAAWTGVAPYLPSHYLPLALIVSLNCRVVLAPGQSLEQANLESLSRGGGGRGQDPKTLQGRGGNRRETDLPLKRGSPPC